MVNLKFFKVRELPHGAIEANAIYYVKGPGDNGVKSYVTDEQGNAFPATAEADVGSLDLGEFN